MPKTRYDTSSDHLILVDEAAQPIPTPNLAQLRQPAFRRLIPVMRRTLAQGAVGSVAVEVVEVLAEHTDQLVGAEKLGTTPQATI